MTKQDVINYQNKKKEQYKQQLLNTQTVHGVITGFSDKEFNQSMKLVQSKGKKGQNPKFTQNRMWNYNNIQKSNEFEIVVGGKIYKKVVR